jgi:hypothetical protein
VILFLGLLQARRHCLLLPIVGELLLQDILLIMVLIH